MHHDFKIHTPSQVEFECIQVDIDAQYQLKLNLDTDAGLVLGHLDDKPFARGGMKLVFNVRLS